MRSTPPGSSIEREDPPEWIPPYRWQRGVKALKMGNGVPFPEPDDPYSVTTPNTLRVGIDNGQGVSGNAPDPVWGWWVRRESISSKPALKEVRFKAGSRGFRYSMPELSVASLPFNLLSKRPSDNSSLIPPIDHLLWLCNP